MQRIIDISYEHRASHIGSSITTYPILESIYKTKNPEDIVILSSGHAGLAQYVALEKFCGQNASTLHDVHGVHPHRDPSRGIHVSSGSLGCAILVAVGMAFGNKNRNIYCVLSDGECDEGSVWEALSFAEENALTNLKIHVNINGYSAYQTIDQIYLENRLRSFFKDIVIWNTSYPNVDCMKGLQAHYTILKDDEYNSLKTYFSKE
jgi:transketolase